MAEFHCNLLRVLNPDRVIMTTFSKSKRDHAGVKKSWCDRLNEKCSDKAKATLWRQKKYGLSPLLLLWATLTFMPPVGLRLSNYLLIYKERSKDSVCVCVWDITSGCFLQTWIEQRNTSDGGRFWHQKHLFINTVMVQLSHWNWD